MKKNRKSYQTSKDTEPKYKIDFKPQSENQYKYLESIKNNIITFAIGYPGVGKTFIAIACGLHGILSGKFSKLTIVRPAIAAIGDEIGFLKGSVQDKMAPFAGSAIDNILQFINYSKYITLVNQGLIEVIPLAYLRGRSLDNTYLLCEEAQNLNIEAMKMVLTRIGKDTKLIVAGDLQQTDLSMKEISGLLDAITRFRNTESIGIIELYDKVDIIRNPLIKIIIDKYEDCHVGTKST